MTAHQIKRKLMLAVPGEHRTAVSNWFDEHVVRVGWQHMNSVENIKRLGEGIGAYRENHVKPMLARGLGDYLLEKEFVSIESGVTYQGEVLTATVWVLR